MSPLALLRPYVSAFASRSQQLLQYRSAALAGFATQCWWGGLKVMIFVAFYGASSAAAAPITLSQAITYAWIAQASFILLPWIGDPDVVLAVRSGAVSYERLRPVDLYSLWFARAAGWLFARMAPRAAFMALFAGVALNLVGLGDYGWHLPPTLEAAVAFAVSAVLAVLLSASFVMLINVIITAAMSDRGVTSLAIPLSLVFSGNLLPLPLFPDELKTALLLQPYAGLLDIPSRIYFGELAGSAALAGIGLQLFWIAVLVAVGRWGLARAMHSLEVQGG